MDLNINAFWRGGALAILLLLCSTFLSAQILKPVKWSSSYEHMGGDDFELVYKATIKSGWAVYSQYLPSDDGPVATSITYDDESFFKLQGDSKETGGRKEGFDPIFEMDVVKFQKTFTIRQKIKITNLDKPITGYLNFMTCDDTQCLPPMDYDFSFTLEKGSDKPQGTGSVAPPKDVIEQKKPVVENTETEVVTTTIAPLDIDDEEGFFADEDGALLQPAKWIADITKISDGKYNLTFEVAIEAGWHIYSQYLDGDDGPIPTEFIIDSPDGEVVNLSEFSEESQERVEEYDPFFEMNLIKIKKAGTFSGTLEVKAGVNNLTGYLTFMTCDSTQCLPFDLPIEIDLEAEEVTIIGQEDNLLKAGTTKGEGTPVYTEFDYDVANSTCGEAEGSDEEEESSYWWILLLGFGGGLLAILTPCVFPMIPLTISYFTKSSNTKAAGIRNAIYYGLSIIVIYLVLGLLITGIFGADALNLLSTNAWFNILFAVLFIVFAISFFGYFEITLPASWVNTADQASDRGGLLGIFFMAFTLSLVSFSCTGPIIGTLLVETATGGGEVIFGRIPVAPLMGMLGFALALALPFALFAAFPGWLNSLPRSGGWMNSIKVTLGFVEIALALKFLSIADLTMGWKILPYEAFVFLWVLCAVGLAAYYFGLIRFPHDSPLKEVSNLRKVFGVSMLLLAVYFSFGFRYSEKAGTFATPNLLSGLAPPAGHSYIYPNSCPQNLTCYKDYYEGMEVAKKLNKPVLIDFTGHGCVNCRRMEDQVWSQDGVYELLRDDYVLISLYVDERKELDEPYTSTFSGREMRNIGNKWSDFQAIHFNRNSQPYYVLSTPDGHILNKPVAYTPDVSEYQAFLECGLSRFGARK